MYMFTYRLQTKTKKNMRFHVFSEILPLNFMVSKIVQSVVLKFENDK